MLVKLQIAGPTLRVPDLGGLGGTQGFTSNKSPGDADAAGRGTTV